MILNDKKIFLTTSMNWACWPHIALSSKINAFLKINNFIITDKVNESDYVIINTCWFDDFNETNSIDIINKLYNDFSFNNNKIIIIWCLPDISISNKKMWKNDKILISDRNIWEFDNLFEHNISINDISNYDIVKPIQIDWSKPKSDYWDLSPLWDENMCFVEISKWCNQSCSYCSIKRVKWNTSSKEIDNILKEIDRWINMWYNKVFLISDDCWSYWEDIWIDISILINNICRKFPKLLLLFNYFEPSNFIKYFYKINKKYINNIIYINIPIQTTSQRILKLMNRDYNISNIISSIENLKKDNKKILITTQMIYWFPSESIDEFKKMLYVINIFDHSSFFCFSPKEKTVASNFKWRLLYKDLYTRTKIINKLINSNFKNKIWIYYWDNEKFFKIIEKYDKK